MTDTLQERVNRAASTGKTAIQIHEAFRKQGLDIPWVAVLQAYTTWQQSQKKG